MKKAIAVIMSIALIVIITLPVQSAGALNRQTHSCIDCVTDLSNVINPSLLICPDCGNIIKDCTCDLTLIPICPDCGNRLNRCTCNPMILVCPDCGNFIRNCTCPITVICKICGQVPCICFPIILCIICGQSPCVCDPGLICQICLQSPCICEPLIIPRCPVCGNRIWQCICPPEPPEPPDDEPEDIIEAISMMMEQQKENTEAIVLVISVAAGAMIGAAFIDKWKPGV